MQASDENFKKINRILAMFCSSDQSFLLKTQQALQILAINFKPPIIETRRWQGEAPNLSHEIFKTIDFSIF
ncbi:hypothetical protein C1646_754971 [Rhizophagus diaphanus]|nr:hypothetical protein C1646_754971 [Rhizophagus diaphanus] [Rhizophagus sp. MUCL 43196]